MSKFFHAWIFVIFFGAHYHQTGVINIVTGYHLKGCHFQLVILQGSTVGEPKECEHALLWDSLWIHLRWVVDAAEKERGQAVGDSHSNIVSQNFVLVSGT